VLALFGDNDGESIFPSVGRLAWMLGCSERTVQRNLTQLIDLGVIEVMNGRAGGRGRRTQYRILGVPARPLYGKGDSIVSPYTWVKGDTIVPPFQEIPATETPTPATETPTPRAERATPQPETPTLAARKGDTALSPDLQRDLQRDLQSDRPGEGAPAKTFAALLAEHHPALARKYARRAG
jgi:DNA-binding transcriptional MocR family regulator